MYKVVPVVHIEKHTELELLIHYKLYCDVFPYFTLLRALSGLIRLLPIEKFIAYTRKNLTTCLQTSRQQVVFARLVTSCQQVWNKLLTTCNNLVDIIRLVTRFSSNKAVTIMI